VSGPRCSNPGCKECEAPEVEPKENVLEEALRLTANDRQSTYGHPRENHACTAALYQAYLERKGVVFPAGVKMDAIDVCWLNILQKASRDAFCRKRDNYVDTAGYARNAEMVTE
jgi:hypothetical protein